MRTLYTYFRSSAAYRVRIALHLKDLPYESIFINLRTQAHQNLSYVALNPQQLVPTFIDQGKVLTQSLAIIEFLEDNYPETIRLLPQDPYQRAKVKSFALAIATDIHPLNNLRVVNYLSDSFDVSQEEKDNWYHHWLHVGFKALEKMIEKDAAPFCFSGNTPTLADICLVPQVYNALRFNFPMENYPSLKGIYDYCATLPAFYNASPEQQEDFSL